MEIKEVKDKNVWEDFLLSREEKTFLQSWNWGKFQEIMGGVRGRKIWRLGVFDEGILVGTALISKISAKRGTFLLIQHGPVFAETSASTLRASAEKSTDKAFVKYKLLGFLLEELKKIGKDEGASFIRMNPLWERSQENRELFKSFGFKEAPMHASAYEATLKLDISPSEEELTAQMRKTTRYLIRQASKNPDFEITKSSRTEDVELYDKLNQKVAKRQEFIPFSFEFVKNEFDVFVKDNQALFFFGKYREEIVASALIIFWSGIGFYHHAALDPKFHNLPISYLLQWEAIKEAKRKGCKLYDFWGYVNPKTQPKHPWAGPTLFKMGFGGQPFGYVKTQDFPLSKKYWLTFVFEKLRKARRNL